jgi:uroporphyrinogen-III synthase/cytoskeletal protein RodZ
MTVGDHIIWVTRPEPQASALTSALRHAGMSAIAAPIMEITPIEDWQPPAETPDGLCITSQHAVSALEKLPAAWKDVPVYVAGERSATLVQQAGWKAHSADPAGALPLLERIEKEQPAGAHILYLSGDVLRWDIPSMLRDKQLRCTRIEVYRSTAIDTMPEAIQHAIGEGRLAAFTCYSPRSVEIAAGLLRGLEQTHLFNQITALCISNDIAAAARKAGFHHIAISNNTSETAMVQLAASQNHVKTESMPMKRSLYGMAIALLAVVGLIGVLAWKNILLEQQLSRITTPPDVATAPRADAVLDLATLREQLQKELASIQNETSTEMAASVATLESTIANLQAENNALEQAAEAQKLAEARAAQDAAFDAAMAAIPSDLLLSWLQLHAAIEAGERYETPLAALQASLPKSVSESEAMAMLVQRVASPVATRDALQSSLINALDAAPAPEASPLFPAATEQEPSMLTRIKGWLGTHIRLTRQDDATMKAFIVSLRNHAEHGEFMAAARTIASYNGNVWPELAAWHTQYQAYRTQRNALKRLRRAILQANERE